MTAAVGGSGRDRAIEAAARIRDEAIAAADRAAAPIVNEVDRRIWSAGYESGYAEALTERVPGLLNALADSIAKLAPYNCELRYDGSEDPNAAAYVEGIHAAHDAVRAAAAGWGTE